MPLLSRPAEVPAHSAANREFLDRYASGEITPNGGIPPSLEAPETTPSTLPPDEVVDRSLGHPLELQSRFQRIAHAPYHQSRWTVVNALWQKIAPPKLQKRAQRMGRCCQAPTLRIGAGGELCSSLSRCRDRLCPLCGERRGRQAAARTTAIVAKFNAPRFITLTLAHREESLSAMLTRLHQSIAALRKVDRWKECVFGGVFGFEVTRNVKARQWHAHAHIIVDGTYLPHAVLKAHWQRITGDSYIVDIRAVADRAKAARYISRYVAKPVDASSWLPEDIREYAAAMHGRRLLQTFGSAHNAGIDDDSFDERPSGSTHLCTAFGLARAVEAGLPRALRASTFLAKMGRDFAIVAAQPWDRGQTVIIPEGDAMGELIESLRGLDDYLLPPAPGRHAPDPDADGALLPPPDPDLPWPI